MADAIVSIVLEQLTSSIGQQIQQEVKLVWGASKEVKRLTNTFQAIKDVLVDADQRQLMETSVRRWLDRLKDVSYDVEDALDEWNTSKLKLQIQRAENALTLKKKGSLQLYKTGWYGKSRSTIGDDEFIFPHKRCPIFFCGALLLEEVPSDDLFPGLAATFAPASLARTTQSKTTPITMLNQNLISSCTNDNNYAPLLDGSDSPEITIHRDSWLLFLVDIHSNQLLISTVTENDD
ncbi:hypothetical protein EZV62_003902 [Acer yangbiense]|uniref:Disease resistance N-terminal domain-containing protein n=1 Tax=Acer yangbiense TaxID=1000413 RepID=A0A5C7II12_9ROSI|nr:hypothetical protein EZV62_003902 [Acer yangbiense]